MSQARARLRIGELARQGGVSDKTVRYYESIGLLPEPERDPNGYRRYSGDAVERLAFIRRAKAAGLRLEAIRDILAIHDAGLRPCSRVRSLAEARASEIERQIAELGRLRDSLALLAKQAARLEAEESFQTERICSAIAHL